MEGDDGDGMFEAECWQQGVTGEFGSRVGGPAVGLGGGGRGGRNPLAATCGGRVLGRGVAAQVVAERCGGKVWRQGVVASRCCQRTAPRRAAW